MFEKHSVIIMALAVTLLALGGVYTTMSGPTITGSIALTGDLPDLFNDEIRLVMIEPRVADAHQYILTNHQIDIRQRFGTTYIALIPVALIPKLKTMARVEFMNS